MFCMLEKKKYILLVSKHNSNHKKQVISLMIPNEVGWQYLAVKKLSVLLRGVTSKLHTNFYSLNCLHSFVTANKREYCKKNVKIKIML